MIRIAHFVVLADGWRRGFIAFVAGAVGAAAMAPIGFFPALVVTMCVAVWLIDGCGAKSWRSLSRRRFWSAATAGWWLGFGYFVAGLYWLGAAFLVEPDRFAWALPLGVLGLPALLAVFPALGFVAALALWRPGPSRVFALALGLGLSGLLRGLLFTGFPWNEFGMALGEHVTLAQSASLVGLYGLTPIAVAMAAAPATLVDAPTRRWFTSPTAWALAALLALAGFGQYRLATAKDETVANVRLRIMQPNVPQDSKFRPSAGAEILRKYLELSDRSTSPTNPGLSRVTHLIWPESAFPFILSREPQALSMIATALGDHTILLTGAIRVEGSSSTSGHAYNSLLAVDGKGEILDSADKTHLVPFGEYLPFSGFLRAIGLRQFIAFPGGFSAGAYRRLMRVPNLPPFQPLICYEAIFPGEVTPDQPGRGEARPQFLLNVTNDGWFGLTAGPYQHFAQARLRTIEEGLPLVRAANTGVSAVVDPYGRVLKSLPLGVEGVLDSSLPKPISQPPFSRHPVLAVLAAFVLMLVGYLTFRRA